MRIDIGTTGGGQVSNTNDQVLTIEFHARSSNAGPAYVGGAEVGAENGRELTPDGSVAINFAQAGMDDHAGRELFSSFYVVVGAAGDKVDWVAILK